MKYAEQFKPISRALLTAIRGGGVEEEEVDSDPITETIPTVRNTYKLPAA